MNRVGSELRPGTGYIIVRGTSADDQRLGPDNRAQTGEHLFLTPRRNGQPDQIGHLSGSSR